MTLGLLITILLAVLDYTGQADLSLFQIFIPMIIEGCLYAVLWIAIIAGVVSVGSKSKAKRRM